MDRAEVICRIREDRLVAVIRANDQTEGENIVKAVSDGGIRIIEITMTVPGALDIIKKLSEKYRDTDVIIGAGTVLDDVTAREVILAGAKFVVSPIFDEATVRLCNRYRIAAIPGVMTVAESVRALEMGVDILKIFPGNAYSPGIIKSFRGPLPQAMFMPTGGVSEENIALWLEAGAVAIGTGSSLTKGAASGDFESVKRTAARFVDEVKHFCKN